MGTQRKMRGMRLLVAFVGCTWLLGWVIALVLEVAYAETDWVPFWSAVSAVLLGYGLWSAGSDGPDQGRAMWTSAIPAIFVLTSAGAETAAAIAVSCVAAIPAILNEIRLWQSRAESDTAQICPRCSTPNTAGLRYCGSCGHDLYVGSVGYSQTLRLPQACVHCHRPIAHGTIFCPHCHGDQRTMVGYVPAPPPPVASLPVSGAPDGRSARAATPQLISPAIDVTPAARSSTGGVAAPIGVGTPVVVVAAGTAARAEPNPTAEAVAQFAGGQSLVVIATPAADADGAWYRVVDPASDAIGYVPATSILAGGS